MAAARQALRDYVQVWDGERWHLFNPASGPVTDLDNLLLWKTDTPAVLEIIGGTRSSVSFSMISHSRSMLALAETTTPDMGLSLYSLPIAEQGMFKLIMLLPVGALVVVFMRLVIGVRTAGTFMPVLIALAFLQTQLFPGLGQFHTGDHHRPAHQVLSVCTEPFAGRADRDFDHLGDWDH